MGFAKDIRRLASDSLIYGTSAALGRMISLITAPILTRVFSPDDYGVIALIQLAIGFFIVIAGMNLGSGVSYYYFHHEDDKKRSDTLITGILVMLFLSALFALFLGLFAPQIAYLLQQRSEGEIVGHDLVHYLRIGAGTLFLGLMMTALQAILRLLHKPKHYFVAEMVKLVTNVGLVLIFILGLKMGVEGVFWAALVASGAGLLTTFIFLRKRLIGRISLVILIPIVTYALPQMPGVLVNWFQSQFGRFLLNIFVSISELGLYSIAFSLASVLTIGIVAFRLAYDPYALSIMKNPDSTQIYARAFSGFGTIFLITAGTLAVFSKPILMVLTPEAYWDAHHYVPFLAIAGFYMGANNILATGIWLSRRTVYTSYSQLIAFVVLAIFSFALIPVFGGVGAAIAYLVGTLTQSYAYFGFGQKLHPIPFRFWPMQFITLLVLAVTVGHSHLVDVLSFWQSFLSASAAATIIGFLSWFGILRTNEREQAWNLIMTSLFSMLHKTQTDKPGA